MRLELVRYAVHLGGIRGRLAGSGDDRPNLGVLAVKIDPTLAVWFRVGSYGVRGAFGFANAAINAFVGVDDECILSLVETVNGTDLDAVHVFAGNAVLGDDICHGGLLVRGRPMRA
tara:strand:- start:273 stop:620 length:348 start_codon:yes stop_codon:yes gene_type:complete